MPMKKITLMGFDHMSDEGQEKLRSKLIEASGAKVPVVIAKENQENQENQEDQEK